MELLRGSTIPFVLVAILACGSSGDEEDMAVQVQEFATDESGLALGGSDPVSYFSGGGPVAGAPAISTNWHGASFRFASLENLALFEADPEHYAPRFGGHCAFGLSMGQAVPANPEAWTISDGRLYLNASPAVRLVWRIIPGVVRRAERNWTRIQSQH